MAIVIATLSGFALLWALVWILIPERPQGGAAPAGPAKSDTDDRRALDAAALLLENLGPCQDGRRQAATAMHHCGCCRECGSGALTICKPPGNNFDAHDFCGLILKIRPTAASSRASATLFEPSDCAFGGFACH
jgi:hypothetical protein